MWGQTSAASLSGNGQNQNGFSLNFTSLSNLPQQEGQETAITNESQEQTENC